MRVHPSLTSDVTFAMYDTSSNQLIKDETGWSIQVVTDTVVNSVTFALTKEAHGMTMGERYLVITGGGLSAELS